MFFTIKYVMEKITTLPSEILQTIKEYIPIQTIVFLNKTNYILYHQNIKKSILNYENYIRDTIRRDNSFVFKFIVSENFQKWLEIKEYIYKNFSFKNYIFFVSWYCVENDSINCRKIIIDFLKLNGLSKNLHKKNIIKSIRWKN